MLMPLLTGFITLCLTVFAQSFLGYDRTYSVQEALGLRGESEYSEAASYPKDEPKQLHRSPDVP